MAVHLISVATTVQHEVGVLGSRRFSVESTAARVCREATNVFMRDLDLPVTNHDERRLEVVADGFSLVWQVSRADGAPRPHCDRHDGAAIAQAHGRKRRTNPELSGSQGRARLVVLAAEVGGRWSEEARSFISQLAKAKARGVPRILAELGRCRWSALPQCKSVCSLVVGQTTRSGL